MYIIIVSLAILIAILLVLIVIVQKSKGSGLASGFDSSNQVMGVRKTTDFLEKATWTLAAILVVLCVASVAFHEDNNAKTNTLEEVILESQTPATPVAPVSPVAPVAPAAE
jgi:preprotein translocase subunit SecG